MAKVNTFNNIMTPKLVVNYDTKVSFTRRSHRYSDDYQTSYLFESDDTLSSIFTLSKKRNTSITGFDTLIRLNDSQTDMYNSVNDAPYTSDEYKVLTVDGVRELVHAVLFEGYGE